MTPERPGFMITTTPEHVLLQKPVLHRDVYLLFMFQGIGLYRSLELAYSQNQRVPMQEDCQDSSVEVTILV